jgi:(p)ppGpp synthase/HD superfamily hydrolase
MNHSSRIDAALSFAAIKHDGQRRKGTPVPYIVHPVQVARLLELHGLEEEVVIAGLLHDVLEDTGCTREELEAAFGPRVAEIVVGCSEPNKALSWEDRKAETVQRLSRASPAVRAVACADKAHNLSTIADTLDAGEDPYPRFERGADAQLAFARRALAVLEQGWEHPLLDELRAALRRLESHHGGEI